jgi:hypothetical protein
MVVLGEGNDGFMCMEVHFASDYLGQIRVSVIVWTPNQMKSLGYADSQKVIFIDTCISQNFGAYGSMQEECSSRGLPPLDWRYLAED